MLCIPFLLVATVTIHYSGTRAQPFVKPLRLVFLLWFSGLLGFFPCMVTLHCMVTLFKHVRYIPGIGAGLYTGLYSFVSAELHRQVMLCHHQSLYWLLDYHRLRQTPLNNRKNRSIWTRAHLAFWHIIS